MASHIDVRYEEEIIRVDIDLEIGNGTVGLFTIDLTSDPYKYMGHIRAEIASALALSLDDFTIKNDNEVIPDTYIAKIYLEETKGQYPGYFLRLDINEDKQQNIARRLQAKLEENKDAPEMENSIIVIKGISEDKDVSLTVYKPCLQLYCSKFL